VLAAVTLATSAPGQRERCCRPRMMVEVADSAREITFTAEERALNRVFRVRA
jgi:hypothetical protein